MSNGNNNGKLEKGEQIEVTTVVQSMGEGDAQEVPAALVTAFPFACGGVSQFSSPGEDVTPGSGRSQG